MLILTLLEAYHLRYLNSYTFQSNISLIYKCLENFSCCNIISYLFSAQFYYNLIWFHMNEKTCWELNLILITICLMWITLTASNTLWLQNFDFMILAKLWRVLWISFRVVSKVFLISSNRNLLWKYKEMRN